MEILSHPGAGPAIPTKDLRACRIAGRRNRNSRIGDFLKTLGLTGTHGTGVPEMLRTLKHNGSLRPIFETDPVRLTFCTTLRIHPRFLSK